MPRLRAGSSAPSRARRDERPPSPCRGGGTGTGRRKVLYQINNIVSHRRGAAALTALTPSHHARGCGAERPPPPVLHPFKLRSLSGFAEVSLSEGKIFLRAQKNLRRFGLGKCSLQCICQGCGRTALVLLRREDKAAPGASPGQSCPLLSLSPA